MARLTPSSLLISFQNIRPRKFVVPIWQGGLSKLQSPPFPRGTQEGRISSAWSSLTNSSQCEQFNFFSAASATTGLPIWQLCSA